MEENVNLGERLLKVANLHKEAIEIYVNVLNNVDGDVLSKENKLELYKVAGLMHGAAILSVYDNNLYAQSLFLDAAQYAYTSGEFGYARKIAIEAMKHFKRGLAFDGLLCVLGKMSNDYFKKKYPDIIAMHRNGVNSRYAKKVTVFELDRLLCSDRFLEKGNPLDMLFLIECDKDGNIVYSNLGGQQKYIIIGEAKLANL